MSKIENRTKYNHSVNLIKYSEDGLKKRCLLCAKETDPKRANQNGGMCPEHWALYQKMKKHGNLDKFNELKIQFKPVWDEIYDKYRNVRKCNTCLEIKPISEFYTDKKSSHGYQNKCISCVKEYNTDPEKSKIKIQKQTQRMKTNPELTIKQSLSATFHSRLRYYLYNNRISISEFINIPIETYVNHIEKQFLPEMNWGNHGKIWEIDHIKPISLFNLLDKDEIEQCFHYTNLQPLFKTNRIAESLGYVGYIGNRNKRNNYEI